MHQMTFEDIERNTSLALQPGRTAFIDECGNFGFEFEKDGTSIYYIVCAVVVKNKDINTLVATADMIRKNNGFQAGEMKSSLIGNNHRRRAKILTDLLTLEYSLVVLIADKRRFFQDSPLTDYRNPFIKYLHQKLYNTMYAAYPKLKIIEDECGCSEFQIGYREYVCAHRPELNLFNEYDFDYVNSQYSPIVQIADVVAGSIMQHLMDNKAPDALNILQGKIRGIVNFPNVYPPSFSIATAEKGYDTDIYALADYCATSYIDAHGKIDFEETRLRVLFLKHLLFVVRNISAEKFVSSAEIIQVLSDFTENRVRRDYLYRRIIAPLRDTNVIISSSSQGYKIPTSVEDIYAYTNQTNGIVGPMLTRVEKCRELILKQSDGDLDIFDDPALIKYKRYFGDY